MLSVTTDVENLVPIRKGQDSSRSTADYFRLLGGVWVGDHYTEPIINLRQSGSRDRCDSISLIRSRRAENGSTEVMRSVVLQRRTGVEFTGAWSMTIQQKVAADRLKEQDPE